MSFPLWHFTRLRRQMAESVGIRTYSRPSYAGTVEKLRRHLPSTGVFVEAGAVDGFFESNTYELERFHGWTGLLVEPVPDMAARIPYTRPGVRMAQCALVADQGQTPYVEVAPDHAMTQVVPGGLGVKVPGRTLSSLLDQHAMTTVDLLSLDIEGYEIEALKGLDFGRHAPKFLLVETLTGQARGRMDAFLGDRYTPREQLTYRDMLYVRQ